MEKMENSTMRILKKIKETVEINKIMVKQEEKPKQQIPHTNSGLHNNHQQTPETKKTQNKNVKT